MTADATVHGDSPQVNTPWKRGRFEVPVLSACCMGGAPVLYTGCPIADGLAVRVVDAAETTGIDFALPLGGRISGVVRIAATGAALAWVQVTARNASFEAKAVSGDDGRYVIEALVSGAYVVEARPAWEGVMGAPRSLWSVLESLATQSYQRPADRGNRGGPATQVTVTAPTIVDGIDFALVRRAGS